MHTEDGYKEVNSLKMSLVSWLVFRIQGFSRRKPMKKGRQDGHLENVIYFKNEQSKKQVVICISKKKKNE